MSDKSKIIASIDKINALYSESPIVKGLVDGGLSFIPFLGSAVTSALDTRSFQIYENNSKQFANEVKAIVDKLDETKIDKEFLDSDEFVSLLTEILARNARTYERSKISLYAKAFVNATTVEKSGTAFKEGFIRIIDDLSVTHIVILALIHEISLKFTEDDKENNRDVVSAIQIANEIGISEFRTQAYCDQMIRFGLLRDWWLGRLNYKPGGYAMTEYGIEFAEFLKTENR